MRDRRPALLSRHRREGTQNLLRAYLAIAVFVAMAGDNVFGAWRPDGGGRAYHR